MQLYWHERIVFGMALGTVWLFSLVVAYYLGRDAEALLTLDAYQTATYAIDQLERCSGILIEHNTWLRPEAGP